MLYTEIIEVVVNSVGVKDFTLGQLPNLRNAKSIKRIEAYNVNQQSISPAGRAVINIVSFAKAYLYLLDAGNTQLRVLPLSSISKTVNGTLVPDQDLPSIDPEKSFIHVGEMVGLVANEAFLLAITYEK